MHDPVRILVVDDTLLIRVMAESILRAAGYDVRTAVDARDARDQWRSWPPDLVLLDLVLPDGDGWSVLAEMRNETVGACVAVFIFSGDDDLDEADAQRRGATGFIHKPFTAGTLLSRVTAVVNAASPH